MSKHAQTTQINKFPISLQYLKKELSDEVDHTMGMVKNYQSSQNSKFAMSLQYLKKELKAEVDLLHVEFPKSLFQHF